MNKNSLYVYCFIFDINLYFNYASYLLTSVLVFYIKKTLN